MNLRAFSLSGLAFPSEKGANLFGLLHRLAMPYLFESSPSDGYFFSSDAQKTLRPPELILFSDDSLPPNGR
jgi:hypothetical protein